jgi:hypothetical protein
LRYEAMRAAAQDYELLKLAERVLPAAEAKALFEKAFGRILRAESIRDFAAVATTEPETLYFLDPQDYEVARRLVLEAVGKKGDD